MTPKLKMDFQDFATFKPARLCLGFICIVGRKVRWIYEICGVRMYESGQDIWQGHLHTRPADLHHPKDCAHDVRIVTM